MANPGSEVMKKLNKSKFIDNIGQEWIYLTVGEAVGACNYMLQTYKPNPMKNEAETWNTVWAIPIYEVERLERLNFHQLRAAIGVLHVHL